MWYKRFVYAIIVCMCVLFEDIFITLMLTSAGCTCGYAYVSSSRTAELSMCIIFEGCGAIDVSSSRAAELSMCPLRGLRSYQCVLFEGCGALSVRSMGTVC